MNNVLAVFLFALLVPASPTINAQTIQGDIEAGRRAYRNCVACHQIGPSARAAFGPQLNGIVGRRAGTTKDFTYSRAMKNAGIVWTEEKLHAFVRNPGKVVPNNKMRFYGLWSDAEANDLIAYLRTLK
ncbi:cytochrome c family protein [uncultured Oxalicibacterium sp.]|uniref:c-type cytochrome n=1 Tax=uncultured Oxalicibacterium sp. TaxID=1168540 RepID=UPI0025FBD35C|nr:cytochrome c family protein [uncultured Oxalicibacterium sp.]